MNIARKVVEVADKLGRSPAQVAASEAIYFHIDHQSVKILKD